MQALFFASIILLFALLWYNYWRVQRAYYSASTLSTKIPAKVIIASLIRDVADRIPEIKQKVEALGNAFDDYHVLIVENDSKDHTRQLLLEWVAQNPKVSILGCGYDAEECKLPKSPKTTKGSFDRERIAKMARLRNIYFRAIQETYGGWDYTIIWDLDAVANIDLKGVDHSIGFMEADRNVSVVCANGIYKFGPISIFYDTFALLDLGENFDITHKLAHDIKKGLLGMKYSTKDPPYEVDSCFSGFSIYRTGRLIDSGGYETPPDNLECEHTTLLRKIKGKKFVNPAMTHHILLND
jgi:hypothetical protein